MGEIFLIVGFLVCFLIANRQIHGSPTKTVKHDETSVYHLGIMLHMTDGDDCE
jgi:hypothetical protein